MRIQEPKQGWSGRCVEGGRKQGRKDLYFPITLTSERASFTAALLWIYNDPNSSQW